MKINFLCHVKGTLAQYEEDYSQQLIFFVIHVPSYLAVFLTKKKID